jgi:diphthine synthase
MLYLIGVGLCNENSISLEGLEAVKKCKKVFLECYTSRLQCDVTALEEKFGKKIIRVNRNLIESELDVKSAIEEDIAILIIGDVFSATTHFVLYEDCRSKGVDVKVINNASVLTAVGMTGLSLYNFGKVASIPFLNENVETPIRILKDNQSIKAHTLFLLDLNPLEDKYLSIKEAIEYLEKNNIDEKVIGCSKLGCSDFVIKYGKMSDVKEEDFKGGPYCLIIPSDKLHFVEEDALEKWK